MPATKPMTEELFNKWAGAPGGPGTLHPPQNPHTADPEGTWIKWSELPRPVSARAPLWARGKLLNEVVYRVLTAGELARIRGEAHRAAVETLGGELEARRSIAYEEIYELEKAVHMLVLGARQADSPTFPVFMNAKDIRENLNDDEIGTMLVAYANHRRDCGPFLSELTDAECEAWLKVLVEGGSRVPLARFSGEALTDLVMYLVSRLRQVYATASSSSGSPPGGSASPAEAPPAV